MKLDLIISADYIEESKIRDKSVLVIDMLRATSVIITAINNGCKSVIPVLTVEDAKELVSEKREKYILGGERKAVKIDGFDCANSPLEYIKEVVEGKNVIITTTNGTRAVKGSEAAKNILLGAMINAKAAAKRLIELGDDIVIVDAGTNGEFSIDDFICSGYIISCILELYPKIDLSDIATTAEHIYENHKDINSFIKYARHYNVIKSLGLEADLAYCCQKDIIDIVPQYKNGRIL